MISKVLFKDKELNQTNIRSQYSDELPVDETNYKGESKVNAIANQTLFGVTHLVDLKIVIEGKECKNFRLS